MLGALLLAKLKKLETGDLPLPHMGWNTVKADEGNPLFSGIEDSEYFYFVHKLWYASR